MNISDEDRLDEARQLAGLQVAARTWTLLVMSVLVGIMLFFAYVVIWSMVSTGVFDEPWWGSGKPTRRSGMTIEAEEGLADANKWFKAIQDADTEWHRTIHRLPGGQGVIVKCCGRG
jgi:hypothetical protein